MGFICFFYGLGKLIDSISGKSGNGSTDGHSKINYYIIKANNAFEPIADFIFGIGLLLLGSTFILFGIRGIEIIELIKKLIY